MTTLQQLSLEMPAEPQPEPIRVFLVDDHPVVRDGVRSILEHHGGIEVVGEAGTKREALQRIAATRPRVVVIDLKLPDGTGTELCAAIRASFPDMGCLIFTSYADEEALFESIKAGADGFMLKNTKASGLAEAIEKVAAGGSLIDASVTSRLLDHIRNPRPASDPRLASLTALERSILTHVAEGRTNRDIAPLVHVSETTVKNYVSSILRKLNLSRRTEAAVFALRSGEF
jgi:DNA-binding NarL/FixJ family response regulator